MRKYFILTLALCLCGFTLPPAYAGDTSGFPHPEQAVNQVIHSVMAEHDIPGMAAGITVHGKRHVFSYGLASKESGQKVTEHTTFEVGSISKSFTTSLAAYAQERDALSLSDKASTYLAPLKAAALTPSAYWNSAHIRRAACPCSFRIPLAMKKRCSPISRPQSRHAAWALTGFTPTRASACWAILQPKVWGSLLRS